MAGLASFALLSIGCAAFLIASGDVAKSVTGAAILLLAIGQVIFIAGNSMRVVRLKERLAVHGKALRDLSDSAKAAAERLHEFEARLADVEAMPTPQTIVQAAPPPPPVQNSTLAEMQALREQLRHLADEIAKPLTSQASPAPPPPAPEPVTTNERLDLLLEPVIELSTGDTSHYRALLHMVSDGHEEIAHDDLMRRATLNNARGKLDLHLMVQSLPVLRRLRQKNGGLRFFVPVGASTLMSQSDLHEMIAILEESRDVATGIVLEIVHGELAKLTEQGVEGLAQLARLGVNMSLTRVSLTGLDLMSLRQLGVRFLDIDARTIDAGFGLAPAWTDFAQFARSMQFQLMAGHIETTSQSQAAASIARFGYGTYFAPPRRVRPGAGQSESAGSRYQAA